jgi:hypothetical protein
VTLCDSETLRDRPYNTVMKFALHVFPGSGSADGFELKSRTQRDSFASEWNSRTGAVA